MNFKEIAIRLQWNILIGWPSDVDQSRIGFTGVGVVIVRAGGWRERINDHLMKLIRQCRIRYVGLQTMFWNYPKLSPIKHRIGQLLGSSPVELRLHFFDGRKELR